MGPVVADTHALLWSLHEPEKLSANALSALQEAVSAGERVYLSAISVVETCYLVEKGKVGTGVLDLLLDALRTTSSGLQVVTLDLVIARSIQQIPRTLVPDMPDRIIAATALHLKLPLVTRDTQIRSAYAPTIW